MYAYYKYVGIRTFFILIKKLNNSYVMHDNKLKQIRLMDKNDMFSENRIGTHYLNLKYIHNIYKIILCSPYLHIA